MFKPEETLQKLEAEITEIFIPEPLPVDKWLASSCMQKALRRGDVTRALPAAVSLWQQDRQNFWRRLHVAAMEDCSADADTVVTVLTVTTASAWRRRVGDLKAGLFLTRLLCQSTKCRAADELYLSLERSACHKELRERFARGNDTLLTDCAMNEDAPLVERAMALWLLAGTKRFPSDIIPQRRGNSEAAKKVLRSLHAPADLVESCIAVMGRTGWPLCLFVPLLWQETQKQGSQLQVVHNVIPACPDVEDIPLYGCDIYTRIGQACFRQLRSGVPKLKRYSGKQIGVAIFNSEGSLLDRFITSQYLQELRQEGKNSYIESTGLHLSDYAELHECLAENMDILMSIRQEKLKQYVADLPTSSVGGQI